MDIVCFNGCLHTNEVLEQAFEKWSQSHSCIGQFAARQAKRLGGGEAWSVSKLYGAAYIFRIDLGAKQLPPDSLLFFCDVDLTITPDFLTRCRHNTVQGKQVSSCFSLSWGKRRDRLLKKKLSANTIQTNFALAGLLPHHVWAVQSGYHQRAFPGG